jgi:hypothetical protein
MDFLAFRWGPRERWRLSVKSGIIFFVKATVERAFYGPKTPDTLVTFTRDLLQINKLRLVEKVDTFGWKTPCLGSLILTGFLQCCTGALLCLWLTEP